MSQNAKRIMVMPSPNATPDYHSINMSVSARSTTPLIICKKPEISFWTMIYAVMLMLASGFFLSVCAALIKWGNGLGFSSMEMLMWRSGMQCVIAILSSFATLQASKEWQEFTALKRMEYVWLALRGVSGAIGVAGYFHAITLIPVGDAITVLSIYPVIAAFLAYFTLREEISKIHFLALIFAVIGVVLISQPSFLFHNDKASHSLLGYVIALCSGVIGGCVFIFIVLAKNAPTTALVCSQGIFCFCIALIVVLTVQPFKPLSGRHDWLCFVGLGIGGFLAQWTFNQGAKLVPAGLSSLLRSSDTIWSYVWQIIWFREMPNWITIVGAIGVVSGVAMVSMEKIRHKKQSEQAQKQLRDFYNKSHTHLSMM